MAFYSYFLPRYYSAFAFERQQKKIVDCDKIQNKSLLYNYFPITIDPPDSPTKTTQTTYAFFTACGQVKPSGGKVGGSHLQHVPSIDL